MTTLPTGIPIPNPEIPASPVPAPDPIVPEPEFPTLPSPLPSRPEPIQNPSIA